MPGPVACPGLPARVGGEQEVIPGRVQGSAHGEAGQVEGGRASPGVLPVDQVQVAVRAGDEVARRRVIVTEA